MPILDWTRTDLYYELETGATCLCFDADVFAAFDLFIVIRDGAEAEYTAEKYKRAEAAFTRMDDVSKQKLIRTIIAGLPGSEESYTVEQLRDQLTTCEGIDAGKLRENLALFLQEVIPVCIKTGSVMAIHPDDPPRPLLGLPSICSTEADYAYISKAVDHIANGFTYCTGCLGVRAGNDLVGMVQQ